MSYKKSRRLETWDWESSGKWGTKLLKDAVEVVESKSNNPCITERYIDFLEKDLTLKQAKMKEKIRIKELSKKYYSKIVEKG